MTGTFEGTGSLQFTPDGKHAYAYSGKKTVTATPSDILTFETNSEYLVGEFKPQQSTAAAEGDDCLVNLYFNNILIVGYILGKNSFNEYDPSGTTETKIIIPPFTQVRIEMDNLSGGSMDMCVTFIAKVKGAIEQIDLEAITDGTEWAL
jgi:hypothetical protein